MNVSFWASMMTLLLLAIALVIYPLLRTRKNKSLAYKTSNIQLHEEKVGELNIDLQEGRIDQADYKIAKQELDRELLEDTPVENKESANLHYTTEAKKHPVLALSIVLFLSTLTFLVYFQLGMHSSTEQVATVEPVKTEHSVEDMVLKLEQYLESNKGEMKDWVMLARSYKYMARYGEAANAYAAANMIQPNPQLMLEQAEVLALVNGKRFNDEARQLVLKALSMMPDNLNALWFAGVVEFQFANYRQSIKHLSQLKAEAIHDPEVNRSIRFYISQAREKLIAAGEEVADLDELVPDLHVEPEVQVSLQVSIDISEAAKKNFKESDVVFVYAKALTGPKMPLAAHRMTLADLPTTVVLDDSMGMMEGMNLSAFNQVVVSARVAKAGTAIAQSGDYIGQVVVNDVRAAKALNINIDSVVP